MSGFKPDGRQQKLINTALRSHRKAQARGRPAPRRLVEKWSSEVGIEAPGTARDKETSDATRPKDDDVGHED